MIPDHLIDKAAHAAGENWSLVFEWEHDKLHAQVHAALEAVAADIWDEGWSQGMAYVTGMERGTDDDHAITNPYRASETA